MYSLIANLLSIPTQNANNNVTYLACALVLLFAVVVVDLVIRIFRSVLPNRR